MGGSFTLFPSQASTSAASVDYLYFFMLAVTLFFSVVVATLVVVLAVKYRRRAADDVGANIHGSTALEVIWTAIPLLIAMVLFVWGTSVYFALAKPPAQAMEVYVIGKRWMWKAQHLTGHREINQLHVPVGTPVKLLISSEDVIHSYYIPAFRQKMDAVPGKTTTMANGTSVIADEAYLRESILNPTAKMVQGYPPLMPTYQGQISEEGLASLIAYIKSLGASAPGSAPAGTPAAEAAPAAAGAH